MLATHADGVDVVGPGSSTVASCWAARKIRLSFGQGVLERPRDDLPADHERHHHVGEYDDVPERNDGQCLVDFH